MVLTQAQKDFIAKIGTLAAADMRQSRILASLTIAQAILESGWGTSELAAEANALFGIKADSRWSGKTYAINTKECYDGKNYVTVKASFRAYDNWDQSLADHSAFLVGSARYAAVIGERDYKKACTAIHAAGYATDSSYAAKLIGIIESYGLMAYDAAEGKETNKMKIYLSPSNQPANKYVVGNTNEKAQMEAVAAKVKSLLDGGYNCEAVMATLSLGIGASERPQECKNKGCDFYLAIHSNAAGGTPPCNATGAVGFYHPDSAMSKALMTAMVAELNAICPVKSNRATQVASGMTQFNGSGYGEIRSPMQKGIPSALIEVNFHDNISTAQWIIDNKDAIAAAIVKSIVATFGVMKRSGTTTPPPSTPTNPTTPTTPVSAVKKGDTVKLASNAAYYDGKAVPDWVKNQNWIVSSVSGDRAVIDKSTDSKNSINSPVNTKFLIVINKPVPATPVPAAPGFQPYTVKVTADILNIRKGPGTNYAIVGTIKDKGVYTMTEEKSGWGRLKSGAGWISLSYVKKI